MKNYQELEGKILSVECCGPEIIFQVETKKGIFTCYATAFSDLESTYKKFNFAKIRIYKDKKLKNLIVTLRSV